MAGVYALIPARAGSKGIPDKNIAPLAGRPLLCYTIAAARAAGRIDRVVVSTDSPAYARIARENGAEAPFLRPAEFATDRSADYAFVAHALDWFEANEGSLPDLVVHLRPTTPLRDPARVDEAVAAFQSRPQATALRSVQEMPESAYKVFEIEGERLKRVFSGAFDLDAANEARQAFPKTYYPNGYVDLLRTSFVRAEKKIHGSCVFPFVTEAVTEVDAPEDLASLEFDLARNPDLEGRLFGAEAHGRA